MPDPITSPASRPSPTGARRLHTVPPGTHALGMWLFLAALMVLFVAGMLAYIIIRLTSAQAPPLQSLKMPLVLWLSTAAILTSSYTIHRAVENIRHERQDKFRQALVGTLLLAVPFFLAQGAGLASLLAQTAAMQQGGPLMKAVVFLVIVHALHVVGGLVPLIVITRQAHAGRYDHEYHTPVENLARYWHFLDVVWLLMFGVFVVLG
ncbi:MAG: cytochrome c oxidase subunit 3 [Planctomycetota bacterium]